MGYSREQLLQLQHSARVLQSEWDEIFSEWGFRAPEPRLGQLPSEYDRDMAVKAKKLLPDGHELKQVQYRSLDDKAFQAFRPGLRQVSKDAALRPDAVAPGEMRKLTKIENGHEVTRWIGQHSFIHDLKPYVRHLRGIRTPDGFWQAKDGRYVR